LKLALRPTIPARERFYANTRTARRGNAPLRQTGSTAGSVFFGEAVYAASGNGSRSTERGGGFARIVRSACSRTSSGCSRSALIQTEACSHSSAVRQEARFAVAHAGANPRIGNNRKTERRSREPSAPRALRDVHLADDGCVVGKLDEN
jgi:hypothetical protein